MAARETVEDIDGLAEYITYHHDETDAPAATLAAPEPEPEPQPQPEPRGTDHAEAVASAAGQLRRFASASAFTRQDEEQIAAAARRILAVTGDAEGRRGVVEAGVPARCIPLLKHFCAAVTEAAVEADRAAPVPPALPPLLKCLRNLCVVHDSGPHKRSSVRLQAAFQVSTGSSESHDAWSAMESETS